ncbi:cytochrome P450 [Coprinopsis marcescibilis]|uniref:Cytochrome P450 n=1 Tax=Coprinopsis marcescibilis TaxID=230819 RepID=A0A5C3L2L8_COPMA|nr:cytochrome P450 [Coprinopsis marcescibilis]
MSAEFPSMIPYYLVAGFVGWVTYEWYLFTSARNKLSAIPTVGSDSFIVAYISAWKYVFSGRKMVQEGYEKYPNGIFKVPSLETPSRWIVVVNGQKLIQEIKDGHDNIFSATEHFNDILQIRHIWGAEEASKDQYHVHSIANGLTRNLTARFPDIIDEVEQSFTDEIPISDEWVTYQVQKAIAPVTCRTANRLFVGMPLCRDQEYLDIQQNFAVSLMVSVTIVNLVPDFMKPIVGKLVTTFPKTIKKVIRIMKPMLEHRLQMEEEHGKRWDGRPNDMISWLLDHAPPEYRTVEDLATRILVINFAAIHTTTMTVTNAVFDLILHPEYIEPLRQEIGELVDTYGWTKEAASKMCKLDSFLKESSRVGGIASISMARKIMEDYTFSNGVTVPAGASVSAAAHPIHQDPTVYSDASTFDGFRFSEKRKNGSDEYQQFKHQLITPTNDYLLFGWGRHACPGRFFAVNEAKCMVAHLILTYDIKLPPDAPPPTHTWFGSQRLPSSASIMFRKRQR